MELCHMNRPTVIAQTSRMQESDLCGWLGEALPGDQLIYHRGFLAVDCNPATSRLVKPEQTRLGRVAPRARLAQELGLGRLVQRRHTDGEYSYIIVACARRLPPSSRETSHHPVVVGGMSLAGAVK
jgi:hypothetical protein